ncbi:hypothetical protein TMU01_14400 [Tenuibacillus multivorans]|nr:hypothetical protein TMU01_14400 [Tenuibacillus multivorans]
MQECEFVVIFYFAQDKIENYVKINSRIQKFVLKVTGRIIEQYLLAIRMEIESFSPFRPYTYLKRERSGMIVLSS